MGSGGHGNGLQVCCSKRDASLWCAHFPFASKGEISVLERSWVPVAQARLQGPHAVHFATLHVASLGVRTRSASFAAVVRLYDDVARSLLDAPTALLRALPELRPLSLLAINRAREVVASLG